MSDHETDKRLTRLEAKQDSLETYLPALLDAVRASQAEARQGQAEARQSQAEARAEFRRLEERVETALRFTRAERIALIVALSAIAATLFAALVGFFSALPLAP